MDAVIVGSRDTEIKVPASILRSPCTRPNQFFLLCLWARIDSTREIEDVFYRQSGLVGVSDDLRALRHRTVRVPAQPRTRLDDRAAYARSGRASSNRGQEKQNRRGLAKSRAPVAYRFDRF
jgi:hypothetical protein